jgi:hypothetical protein
LLATGRVKSLKLPSLYIIGNTTKLREIPKDLATTLLWKHFRGTRLIAEPNGKKVKYRFCRNTNENGQSAAMLLNPL